MKAPDEAYYQQWAENPEPSLPEKNPQVILDAGMSEVVWLYDAMNEGDAWLTYNGEPKDLQQ